MEMWRFEQQMTRIIPSFAGFTEFTTSIPKMYWDVKSQEQRILGICKMLNKVICYADMLGENVDEIAKTLKDIEDGKLDDMITAAIEAWFEDHEQQILDDISDLQRRVQLLEDEDVRLKGLIDDEEAERIRQDGLLQGAIETEENARKATDTLLQDYVSIHNETYDIAKPFNMFSTKNSVCIEFASEITESDIEEFTYAGKTVDEIFDENASWIKFIMPSEITSIPEIQGISPTVNGEVGFDTPNSRITFDSWDSRAENSAYIRWQAIPMTNTHVYAIFALMEFDHYKRGKFGFETAQVAYSVGAEGNKQIIGHCGTMTSSTMNVIIGNLPHNTGLFIFEKANMYSSLYDMCLVDLTELFANGQSDNPDRFADAYMIYLASKNLQSTKMKTRLLTALTSDVSDLEAYNTFIGRMNEYAWDMQFANTVFNSASGYPSYPGANAADVAYNNYSTPIDMLKLLIACGMNDWLCTQLSKRYSNWKIGQSWWSTDITAPNAMVDPDQVLNYQRIYGKTGQLPNTLTDASAPYGVYNLAAACVLPDGHTGYISVMNTPWNTGSGLTTANVIQYYYRIQQALGQVISGTDPSSVTYNSELSDAMAYSAQPTSFAAIIAPEGFDKASIIAMNAGRLKAWLSEAKIYLGNNSGLETTDTQCITASMSKMMVALIAAREGHLDDIIELHETDYLGGSGAVQFSNGEKANKATIILGDAISAMMYYSDNTLATAIARHIGYQLAGRANVGSGLFYLS